jgi:hypothetical protein
MECVYMWASPPGRALSHMGCHIQYENSSITSVLDFNDYLAEIKQGKINKISGIKETQKAA